MTAQERPAGRPACGARPAGARRPKPIGRPTVGTDSAPAVLDPTMIRRALAASDRERHADVAVRFGVATSTITRWRGRRAAAAAHGEQWPSDADVALWEERQPVRRHRRVQRLRWQLRRVVEGAPLLIDSTGTRRRLQALAAIGWRYRDLAEQLGVTHARVGHLAIGSGAVHRDTAAAVAAVYDRLSMTPGPSRRCRILAAGHGWPPPLAWDDQSIDDPAARPSKGTSRGAGVAFDEVAVQRAMHGDRVPLRPPERAEAVRRLTAQRLSAAEIAAVLDTSPRNVTRLRSDNTTRRSA